MVLHQKCFSEVPEKLRSFFMANAGVLLSVTKKSSVDPDSPIRPGEHFRIETDILQDPAFRKKRIADQFSPVQLITAPADFAREIILKMAQ
jgi:hypothetical protein